MTEDKRSAAPGRAASRTHPATGGRPRRRRHRRPHLAALAHPPKRVTGIGHGATAKAAQGANARRAARGREPARRPRERTGRMRRARSRRRDRTICPGMPSDRELAGHLADDRCRSAAGPPKHRTTDGSVSAVMDHEISRQNGLERGPSPSDLRIPRANRVGTPVLHPSSGACSFLLVSETPDRTSPRGSVNRPAGRPPELGPRDPGGSGGCRVGESPGGSPSGERWCAGVF
jgi:hypothetical protein